MVSFAYIILSLLGLSFLIFIHELGHYWAAKRVGMRVETFAIGFGKPIFSWERNGVQWQVGWLFFGGYVKIAGQEGGDSKVDPYTVPDGFFGKTPWQRIQVALAGPLMNLAFALLAFGGLWMIGGREKNFSELTTKIGWVDPNSELYVYGIRPGDEIVSYGDYGYQTFKDHIYAPTTVDNEVIVKGYKVDYINQTKELFSHPIKTYSHPAALDKGIKTAGITQPASYIIYDRLTGGEDNPLPEGSPLANSGLELGDRIVWVDGEVIFSLQQLNHILNDDRVLLTVQRGDATYLRRVPRVEAQELRMDPTFREELTDWQYEADLGSKGRKLQALYTIPYNITDDLVIEEPLRFIDHDDEVVVFPSLLNSEIEEPLKSGDTIIAINGVPLKYAYQLLEKLQQRRASIIVARDANDPIPYDGADKIFDTQVSWSDLNSMAASIGKAAPIKERGHLRMLEVVTPKRQSEFFISPEAQALFADGLSEQKKLVEQIEDPEERAIALNILENQENQLFLGIKGVQDRKVIYNPGPFVLFGSIFNEIKRTLTAFVTGSFSPKWLSGPIGIVHVVHERSMVSMKEALFWLGFISLNLGVINLLPIPVLDGGTILFSLYEWVSRRRIKPKTMERLIIPFALLLIAAFVFLTYNDVARIFHGFFS